jgi:uncharacterized protein (TIGR03083 family)
MGHPVGVGVGDHYRRSRLRLTALLADVDDDGWQTPVPACPGWAVHDVVGHLLGVTEDALAGELTGPPGEAQTAVQVERHRRDPHDQMLARWTELAPPFEDLLTAAEVWPGAVDAHSHEHDVRGALSRPGARDDELVLHTARRLIEVLDAGATITFDLGHETVRSRPKPGQEYLVRTDAFEVFRLRMGRRSRSQVVALDWSADPAAVVDSLFIFGPAAAPVVE